MVSRKYCKRFIIFLFPAILAGIIFLVKPDNSQSLGEEAAEYAVRFVGNPYVYGGESLTRGADCSGFIKAVYGNFGIETVRTSKEFERFGIQVCKGFQNKLAKPGDIICYDGHVGLYIGDGQIVHSSNSRDGIKISPVNYQKVLCVRRIKKKGK